MVTGCFDLLHSGHVAFLREAARYGRLFVCIGSDRTVQQLKGHYPVNSQEERRYMLEALACVHDVRVNRGQGMMDFTREIVEIRPDLFFVNEDGHTPAKEELCHQLGIEYVVSKRIPEAGMPSRSTTTIFKECYIPYRLDLAGGWLDQPWVSKFHPGPVINASLEPTFDFNVRSGMATSTRKKAMELWQTALPEEDVEKTAKLLFGAENPVWTKKVEVAGSQDAIGIVYPGIKRLYYEGEYWPEKIETILDESTLLWLEQHLYLVSLGPRAEGYSALSDTQISTEGARDLSTAAEGCWSAIQNCDIALLGHHLRQSFEAQIAMFPRMVDSNILEIIDQYRDQALGWKLTGAGGGGYLVLVSDKLIDRAIKIKIRRKEKL